MSERKVTVKTYDVRGMLVSEEQLGTLAATGPADDPDSIPHTWTWTTDAGTARSPVGIYWLEFAGGDARAVKKLTLLH
jgi:hypothetical protein